MKLLLMLFFLFTTLFCYSQNDSIVKFIPFEKEQYKIQLPEKWSLDTTGKMKTDFYIFSPLENDTDEFRENLNLYIQDLSGKNIDLNKYVAISEKQIKKLVTNGEIYYSHDETNATSTYHKIIYGMSQGIYNFWVEQYYFIKNEKAYVLTFTAEADKFNDYKKTAEYILNSFVLKK